MSLRLGHDFVRVLCFFAGAIEKQKLVYILNRDASARLTISSPLEAHKAHTLVIATVGVDVGFENPIFACIELDYEVCAYLAFLLVLTGFYQSPLCSHHHGQHVQVFKEDLTS